MLNHDRLTYKTQGDATRGSHYCAGPGIKKDDVVQRLGEYEDTGLSPEEVKERIAAEKQGSWSEQMVFDDGFGGGRIGYICSACKQYIPFKGKFCGECGARMDGDAE